MKISPEISQAPAQGRSRETGAGRGTQAADDGGMGMEVGGTQGRRQN